jgi:Fic family protein
MNLGEARSKFDHIAGVPLRPDVAKHLHNIYLAKGVHGTTAIEGNTLTEEEIQKHMRGQLKLPLSQAYLQQEIDNIINACNGISKDLWSGKSADLTFDRICQFNSMALNKLELETDETPGQIRMSSVGVGTYLGAPAGECEYLTRKLCEWLSSPEFQAFGKEVFVTAILKAILAHLYIAWIHPFGDGNGRTARLVEFQILTGAGVSSPAAHLLSNHYNKTRSEYYRQLDAASKSGGNVIPFIQYAVQGLVDGLGEQLHVVRNFQWNIIWQNYIHGKFGHKDKMTPTELRQHHLALDLSDKDGVVPLDKMREISPRITAAYAKKSNKTLRRDINELKRLELIEEIKSGFRAKSEKILAFLPPHCPIKEPPVRTAEPSTVT